MLQKKGNFETLVLLEKSVRNLFLLFVVEL